MQRFETALIYKQLSNNCPLILPPPFYLPRPFILWLPWGDHDEFPPGNFSLNVKVVSSCCYWWPSLSTFFLFTTLRLLTGQTIHFCFHICVWEAPFSNVVVFQIDQLAKTVDKKSLGTGTWPGELKHIFKNMETVWVLTQNKHLRATRWFPTTE